MTTTEAKPKQEFLFNNEEGIWRNSAKTSQTQPLLIVEGHVYRQCKKNTAECVARFRDNAHVVEVLTAAGCKFLERVLPVQTLKRLFFYQAKVGTMPGSIVAVKQFPKIVTSQTPDNPTLAFGNFFAVNQRWKLRIWSTSNRCRGIAFAGRLASFGKSKTNGCLSTFNSYERTPRTSAVDTENRRERRPPYFVCVIWHVKA
jgi:hypothetical protein